MRRVLPARPRQTTRSRPAASRARPFYPLALLLLAAFGLVLAWRALGSGAEMLRGLTFSRAAPGVAAVAAAKPDPALLERVREAASLPGGNVAVVVRDLRSGASAALEDERPIPAASLFKLPILVEVLKQQRLGRLNPDQPLQIGKEHWADGSGVLQARVGESLAVRELLRLMVEESDNIAALVLLDAVGLHNVNATLEGMGLRHTRLRDRRQGSGTSHLTSARDMGLLLETIASGRLVDARTSEEALRLLEGRQAHAWLADDLPWWVKVAHKWGEVPGARHDAGVVFTPDRSYVLVVLTEGGTAEQARDTIAAVSEAVYDHLHR